jgi:hypothetical protein
MPHATLTIGGVVIKQKFPAYFPLSTLSSRLAGTLLGRPCPFFARSLTLDRSMAVRTQNPQYVDNAVVPSKSSGTGFPCQRLIVVPCLQSSSAHFLSRSSDVAETVAVG